MSILNENSPTRLPTNGPKSSPDLSICTAHLSTILNWHTLTTLNSDHLPILISFPDPHKKQSKRPIKTYFNFKKADWDLFTTESEIVFSSLPNPSSCQTGEKLFRKTILSASKRSIPAGFRKNFIPQTSVEVTSLILQRDSLRKQDPTDPQIPLLNAQISSASAEYNRKRWEDTISKADHRSNPSKLFSLIKSISGKSSPIPPNQPITFGNKTFSKPKSTANAFAKQFTSHFTHKTNPSTRLLIRNIHSQHPLDNSFTPFDSSLVQEAISNSSNSTSIGPDGLTILHLKHLGPYGLCYLTKLYNLSLQHANIPAIWKSSIIIPLLKPGKSPDSGASYRPISLLSPAAKVLERLLLPLLKSALPTHSTQHGFKSSHSTTSALLPLATAIAEGFNEKRPPARTTAVAIDFSKAFDCIPHNSLLKKISSTSLHSNIIRWLTSYLRGRRATCSYNQARSRSRPIYFGVPQGAVISPILFNFYVSDCPTLLSALLTSFADDFTAANSSKNPADSEAVLNSYLAEIEAWSQSIGLSIAPEKSSVTLFTSHNRESKNHPQIFLDNELLPLKKSVKILGVTFDTHFTFSHHISDIISRASSRLNVLKSLAGSDWGAQKETMLFTYRTILRPILTYASPIWFPNLSNSNILKIQRIQNQALRICLGVLQMSSFSHLHSESKYLPVKEHLTLLSSQFLASALRPDHPAHPSVTRPPGSRSQKHTLQSLCLDSVSPFLLPDGTVQPSNYKLILENLHHMAVHNSIQHLEPNPILNTRPPEISKSEIHLPRPYRSTLSQLRSNYCSKLKSYQHRIDPEKYPSPSCPHCSLSDDTTTHLFNCPSNPTTLSPIDLWHYPINVSKFLANHPSFSDLPPLPALSNDPLHLPDPWQFIHPDPPPPDPPPPDPPPPDPPPPDPPPVDPPPPEPPPP